MAFHGISPDVLASYKQQTIADPPPGVIPDYQNSRKAFIGVVSLCTINLLLISFFVAMRVYTGHFVIKKMWWDDYFSVLAWVFFIPLTAFAIISQGDGAGRHMWNAHYSDYVQISYDSIIIKAIYFVSIVMVKLSVLFQYLKIFVPARRGNETMYYGALSQMVLNVLFYLVELFINIFQCSPQARAYNRLLPGTCIGTHAGTSDPNIISTAIFNVVSDIVILLLPLNRVWRLQLPLRTKLGVFLVFGTGAIVCLTSILRLYYSHKFINAMDELYWGAFLVAWLYLEVAVGVIVGCMPSFPKFAQHVKGLWKKNRLTELRLRSTTIQRAPKSRLQMDPYDIHRHLNRSNPLLEGHSTLELDERSSHSPSAKGPPV